MTVIWTILEWAAWFAIFYVAYALLTFDPLAVVIPPLDDEFHDEVM